MNKARTVSISATDDLGCIVQVGCKTLVFSTIEKMAGELVEYFNHPKEKELECSKKYGWASADEMVERPTTPGRLKSSEGPNFSGMGRVIPKRRS